MPLIVLQHFRGNLDNWDPADTTWAVRQAQYERGLHGIEADVQLQLVDDPAVIDQVTEAYRIKYRNQGSLLSQFLRTPATGATLQLEA